MNYVWPNATVLSDEMISTCMFFYFYCEHVHNKCISDQMKVDHQTVPGELNFSTRTTVILLPHYRILGKQTKVAAKI